MKDVLETSKNTNTTHQIIRIDIREKFINTIFKKNEKRDQLWEIYIDNKQRNNTELKFYTDGSVHNIGTIDEKIGLGWAQYEDRKIINEFKASISGWAASTRTEIMAILMAIITAKE